MTDTRTPTPTPSRPRPAVPTPGDAIWRAPGPGGDGGGRPSARAAARMDAPVARVAEPGGLRARLRPGLLAKIIVFLAAVLVPLAAVTGYLSVRALRQRMTEEFTSKGSAIANSLASSGVDLILTRDASTVQALVDQFAEISGVAYVMVYDPQRTLVAHTFSPLVPAGIVDRNPVPGDAAQQVRQIEYPDPVTGARREIIDIGVPVLAGQLGTVRVGMDRASIEAAAGRAGQYLLMVFGG